MNQLTKEGEQLLSDISTRYQISRESALHMLIAVNNGGSTMAQFSIPEFGSGQWMRGGMTMVGDLFNNQLKANVNNLCEELAAALNNRQIFEKPPVGSGGGQNWWPAGLSQPSSTGGQNNSRYAVFPNEHRLVVEIDGQVSVYDTLNHMISGVSQQQGSSNTMTFSSQFGSFSTLDLPLIDGPGGKVPAQSTPEQPAPPMAENSDIYESIRKLGQLRDDGILTEEEFQSKKSEMLSRI
ncbi:MAG: SHOCT domain-containing protein [Verrucomicrobiales bacterium]|nr:SHOCT domain-containing protein [Verrucomicrobiales bacterium]